MMSCDSNSVVSGNGDHPIFSRDPLEWIKLVHTKVSVTTEDGNQHEGWVYTVDPVSESIVLVDNLQLDSLSDCSDISVRIIIGGTISRVESISSVLDTNNVRLFCDRLFRPAVDTGASLNKEDVLKRRTDLKTWLEKHRISVSVGGQDGQSLSVFSDALIIQPPFTEEDCLSTNEIILSKIQELIKAMPKG